MVLTRFPGAAIWIFAFFMSQRKDRFPRLSDMYSHLQPTS